MASPVLRMSMSGALCVRKRPIALTRRSDIPPCGIADCAPAQCCVWPVLAPAQAFVRAGERRGEMRNSDTPRQVDSGCLDVLRSARLLLWLCRGGCAWCAPDIAALLGWLRSICVSPCGSVAAFGLGSRLLFDALRQTGRLAGCCVPIPPWVVIANSAFSWCRCGYLPWRVHFGFVRFFMAIPTGYRDVGNGVTRGTGLAARRLCVFAQSHWPCNAFRGEYAGAARPRLRQRVFDSLDSPQGLAE